MAPNKQLSGLDPQESAGSDASTDDTSEATKEIAESIVATMPVALLVLESDLRVRIASQTFYDTFRVTPDTTVGHLIYNLGNGQWNIPRLRILLEEILPDNQVFIGYEVDHIFEGIGRRTMLLNGRQLDNVQLILLVIVDITERKEMEDELQASHERLQGTLAQLKEAQAQLVQQERLAAVGALASGIAHDFNNILSIIVLNVELGLQTSQMPSKLHQRLSTISQQVKRASRLVQQLLDFGRRGDLHLRPLDLALFLQEESALLQYTLPSDIRINLSYGHDEYIVNADSTHMQQIVTNLAVNALDAMPQGGELGMSLERLHLARQVEVPLPGMEPGEWILMSVSDNGTGISPLTLPHLFEPFFTTKAPGKGTGLGLAQVYGLVQQHHGHITVQTQEEEGTTFLIYLPAYVAHSGRAGTAEAG